MPALAAAVPLMLIEEADVAYVAAAVGAEMDDGRSRASWRWRRGAVAPWVTVSVSLAWPPAQSCTMTVILVVPLASGMFDTLQFAAAAG